MKRMFLLIIIIFLSNCSKHVHYIVPEPSQKNYNLSSFNQIVVNGTINVDLHTGYKHSSLQLQGVPTDLAQVNVFVRNYTLFVSVRKGYPRLGPISANIKMNKLNSVVYQGVGIITGKQLNTRLLDVDINNPQTTTLGGSIVLHRAIFSGGGYVVLNGVQGESPSLSILNQTKVDIRGMVSPCKILVDGDGLLSMYWINSQNLSIRGKDKARIQLAGRVDKLDVELWGKTRFKGRYLRANRAFVKTHDYSVAEMSAVTHQHTLATDGSNIYFYEIPTLKKDFMGFNGSVLDMRDLNQSNLEEYTYLNK